MDNIIENNKLIAEFLNWEFDDLSETFETPFLKLVEPQAFGDEQFSCKLQDFELEFHIDWSWLMQVVNKIENMGNDVLITSNYVQITYNEGENFINLELKGNIMLETVYNACVEFIKWYNKQNKNNESL